MPLRSHHRIALGGAALLSAAWLLTGSDPAPGGAEPANAASAGRPNIVLVQTDDQTRRQFTPEVMPKTKRLLAGHGTSFRHYIATTAECCPSRASLITGQYAHNHGVTSNQQAYSALVDKNNVLPVWLREAGYTTIHVGKFLNGYQRFANPPSLVAPGWDQWYSFLGATKYYDYKFFVNGRVVHRGTGAAANATGVANRKAVRLVRRYVPKARPFYLQLDEPAPHVAGQRDPFGGCDNDPMPQKQDEGSFGNAALARPPSFNERDLRDKPEFLSAAPKLGHAQVHKVKRRWRCGLASLRSVDRGIAQVYRAVEDAGELNRTVFVFVSDNGQFFGEHRIHKGKVFSYDEAVHLPLVIKAPKRYLDEAPRLKKVRKAVANIDLAPTILDLARAQPCPRSGPCRTMDGRSLVPLLTRSGNWPQRRGLLTEYKVADAGRYATCEFAGILTRAALYVEHSRVVDPGTSQCAPADQRERYDLSDDPYELHSRCFGGSAAKCPVDGTQLDLETRLSRLRDCAGVQGRDQRVGGRPFCE